VILVRLEAPFEHGLGSICAWRHSSSVRGGICNRSATCGPVIICTFSSIMTKRCDEAFRVNAWQHVSVRVGRGRNLRGVPFRIFVTPKVALGTVIGVSRNKECPWFPWKLRGYSWGTWTRTKNKRIRISRVANYTIPHRPKPKPGPTVYFSPCRARVKTAHHEQGAWRAERLGAHGSRND
jgi:hypothetical protein